MKYSYAFFSLLESVAGCIIFVWTYTRKPYKIAFEKAGIRIVIPKHYSQSNGENDQDEVYRAWMLLQRFAPEQMERLEKHIRIIFLRPIEGPGQYIRTGRICLLSPRSIPAEYSKETRPIAIAGTLVCLATFAKAKWEDHNRGNLYILCESEMKRVMQKLSDALSKPQS